MTYFHRFNLWANIRHAPSQVVSLFLCLKATINLEPGAVTQGLGKIRISFTNEKISKHTEIIR